MLHRGAPVGKFAPAAPPGTGSWTGDRTLPFDVLEDTFSAIVRLELEMASRSTDQITEQEILRDLVRHALNALDFSEILDLHRLTTQPRAPQPKALAARPSSASVSMCSVKRSRHGATAAA